MGNSCVIEKETIRLPDDLDPGLKSGRRPFRGRGMDHGTMGVGASEPFSCMHQADAFGLVSLWWVGHFSILGPDKKITLTTREAWFFGIRNCGVHVL